MAERRGESGEDFTFSNHIRILRAVHLPTLVEDDPQPTRISSTDG